jgi:hypothetical protein
MMLGPIGASPRLRFGSWLQRSEPPGNDLVSVGVGVGVENDGSVGE